MHAIPLTFRSVGQKSASSARSLLESNYSAGSKVWETSFVFQTSSYSSGQRNTESLVAALEGHLQKLLCSEKNLLCDQLSAENN